MALWSFYSDYKKTNILTFKFRLNIEVLKNKRIFLQVSACLGLRARVRIFRVHLRC